MKWTRELPTEEGFYFVRSSNGEGVFYTQVVYLYEEESDWLYTTDSINLESEYSLILMLEDGDLSDFHSWAGPIKMPEEPKK